MHINIKQSGGIPVAVIESDTPVLTDPQSALDLLADVRYQGSERMLLQKAHCSDDFFKLRTGLAGEILQKFVTYGMRIAIVGDFSQVDSPSLRDFIRESNRGDRVFFLPDEASALEALCR